MHMIYLVRTHTKQKTRFCLSAFYLMLVCLPGLGISEMRDLFFSWSHLDEIEE